MNQYKLASYIPVTTVPVDVKGKETVQLLDYLASSMNNPQFRLSKQIPNSTPEMITPKYEYSPEIMSYDKYGSEYLWWFLCRYNGIIHPLHPVLGFVAGNWVNVPSVADATKWLKTIGLDQQQISRLVRV